MPDSNRWRDRLSCKRGADRASRKLRKRRKTTSNERFRFSGATKTVQSMSTSSPATAHPFYNLVRLFQTCARSQSCAMTSGEMLTFPRVCAALLLAAVTDHGQIRDGHMSVLGIVFIHAVLLHLPLGIFLHPVGCGI